MKTLKSNSILFRLLLMSSLFISSCEQKNENKALHSEVDNSQLSQNTIAETKIVEVNEDEEQIKATINSLLFNVGNYNITALAAMVSDKAMLGISSLKDGIWSNSEIAVNDFFESVKTRERRPFVEIPINYDILITKGQIAIARADCILSRWGIPQTREVNHFTLIKENANWKILNISWTVESLPEDKKIYDLEVFARGYAQAWCSQRPNFVASFFAEDGELTINNGTPAIGTKAINDAAKAFMETFPDMMVSMDSLTTKLDKTRFYWTLTGTNNVLNGTGNKVKISGFEEWTLNKDGLIQKSKGHFDADEYNRQLKNSLEN